jgi:galactokinase
MKKKYNVSGIEINVRYMNLPIKKGLSSSAAICVLTARAFNILYNLGLNRNEIMKIAYESERYALSKCGRLDQICATKLSISHIIFDDDKLIIHPVKVKRKMNYVIVDLNGKKDTKKILSTLHSCFPFPKNEIQEKVKRMLCEENKKIVNNAKEAIENDNLERLGKIMTESQRLIDESAGKMCKDLEGPKLHKIMNDEKIKELSYGVRGIGSNGDGAGEILAKDEKAQEEIIKYLKEKYQMDSFSVNINPSHDIKKAVVPLAGFGTRMYPFTRTVKKAFVPVVQGKHLKPLILKLVEDLDEAGIEKICFIIGKDEEEIYRDFFKKPLPEEHFAKLKPEEKEYEMRIQKLGEKISFIVQEEKLRIRSCSLFIKRVC